MNLIEEISNKPVSSETPMSEFQQPVKNEPVKKQHTNTFLVILILVLALALGAVGYLYYREKQPGSDDAAIKAEIDRLSSRVSQLVKVPEGETPTVATVIDAKKLKKNNPVFYEGVENGDKLLVYSDRVVLYDVNNDVVLNMVLVDTSKLQQTAEDKLNEDAATETEQNAGTSNSDSQTEGDVAGEQIEE